MGNKRVGYNPEYGRIKSDAGVTIDRAFLAHFKVAAADAVAASTTGVLAFTNLGAAAQEITAGITNPVVPRNIVIDGNVSGITGVVTINGLNYAGEVISEDLTANGVSTVAGAKAFKAVTSIELPIQNHTPAAQTETIEVTHGCTTSGDLPVVVTATTLLGEDSPVTVTVPVTTAMDTVTEVAAAVVAALNADEAVGAVFTASNAEGVITLAAKTPLANDSTLAIAFTVGSTGVTVGSSTNGTAGVPYDKISVGWGDIFGLPYLLEADEQVILKLFNKAADAGTVANSATALESNTYDPNGSPDGLKDLDLYIIV